MLLEWMDGKKDWKKKKEKKGDALALLASKFGMWKIKSLKCIERRYHTCATMKFHLRNKGIIKRKKRINKRESR